MAGIPPYMYVFLATNIASPTDGKVSIGSARIDWISYICRKLKREVQKCP